MKLSTTLVTIALVGLSSTIFASPTPASDDAAALEVRWKHPHSIIKVIRPKSCLAGFKRLKARGGEGGFPLGSGNQQSNLSGNENDSGNDSGNAKQCAEAFGGFGGKGGSGWNVAKGVSDTPLLGLSSGSGSAIGGNGGWGGAGGFGGINQNEGGLNSFFGVNNKRDDLDERGGLGFRGDIWRRGGGGDGWKA